MPILTNSNETETKSNERETSSSEAGTKSDETEQEVAKRKSRYAIFNNQ